MTHALKIEIDYFEEIQSGKKTFEVRRHDRPFEEGDTIILQEWVPETKMYTGEEWHGIITHILANERFCKKGFCILSIKEKQTGQPKEKQ
jgi:ASC-1-like (ASCH) protein